MDREKSEMEKGAQELVDQTRWLEESEGSSQRWQQALQASASHATEEFHLEVMMGIIPTVMPLLHDGQGNPEEVLKPWMPLPEQAMVATSLQLFQLADQILHDEARQHGASVQRGITNAQTACWKIMHKERKIIMQFHTLIGDLFLVDRDEPQLGASDECKSLMKLITTRYLNARAAGREIHPQLIPEAARSLSERCRPQVIQRCSWGVLIVSRGTDPRELNEIAQIVADSSGIPFSMRMHDVDEDPRTATWRTFEPRAGGNLKA